MKLNKNDIITLEITALSNEGNGIGRIDDIVVFVPNTAVGDIVKVKIVKVLKSYAFGRLENVITPSMHRIENNCPVFEKCGGCAYRHISYSAEANEKAEQVFHNIKAIGRIDGFIKNDIVVNQSNTERYRNKGQFPVGRDSNGKIVSGFFAPRSHRIIPVSDCLLQPQVFGQIVADCIAFFEENAVSVYDEQTGKGLIRHIYLRQGAVSGEIMVCFVVNANTFTGAKALSTRLCEKYPQIKSIVLNVNKTRNNVIMGDECITLWGSDSIVDEMCGLKVNVSSLSFYQINHDMAQRVYNLAGTLAELKGNETVLDLYCGAGLIGLSVAKKVKKVIGIEIVESAVENAKENASENGITNAEFYCGDASLVSKLIDEGKRFDVAFVDPPRKGCSNDVIDALSVSGADKIVYVSCNSATLARDINLLLEKGYELQSVTPADLFPRTVHTECVALLTRKTTTHNMKLFTFPFEMIKSGQKTIELRLYDEKRQLINVGDTIIFTSTQTGEKLTAKVIKLHIFDSFKELYSALPLLKCGYTEKDIDTAHPSDMDAYYSIEEQNKYGVIGIEICLQN